MKKYTFSIILSSIVGLLLLAMLGKKIFTSSYPLSASRQAAMLVSSDATFTLYELSLSIKSNDPNILLIDIRSPEEYEQDHLPNAINVPIEKLFDAEYSEYIDSRRELTKVIYGKNEVHAVRAFSLLIMNGYGNFKALNGGYQFARDYVIAQQSPSHFFYSDELKKFNYNQLMPSGGYSAEQITTEDIKTEPFAPRGGC